MNLSTIATFLVLLHIYVLWLLLLEHDLDSTHKIVLTSSLQDVQCLFYIKMLPLECTNKTNIIKIIYFIRWFKFHPAISHGRFSNHIVMTPLPAKAKDLFSCQRGEKISRVSCGGNGAKPLKLGVSKLWRSLTLP